VAVSLKTSIATSCSVSAPTLEMPLPNKEMWLKRGGVTLFSRVKRSPDTAIMSLESHSIAYVSSLTPYQDGGLSAHIRDTYSRTSEALSLRPMLGSAIAMCDDDRYIYSMYVSAPVPFATREEAFRTALVSIKEHMTEEGIVDLALSYADLSTMQSTWPRVKSLLEIAFANTDILITICD
jgi:hypothetical protein